MTTMLQSSPPSAQFVRMQNSTQNSPRNYSPNRSFRHHSYSNSSAPFAATNGFSTGSPTMPSKVLSFNNSRFDARSASGGMDRRNGQLSSNSYGGSQWQAQPFHRPRSAAAMERPYADQYSAVVQRPSTDYSAPGLVGQNPKHRATRSCSSSSLRGPELSSEFQSRDPSQNRRGGPQLLASALSSNQPRLPLRPSSASGPRVPLIPAALPEDSVLDTSAAERNPIASGLSSRSVSPGADREPKQSISDNRVNAGYSFDDPRGRSQLAGEGHHRKSFSVDSAASSSRERRNKPSPLSQAPMVQEALRPRASTPEPTAMVNGNKTRFRSKIRRAFTFGGPGDMRTLSTPTGVYENAGPPDESIYSSRLRSSGTDSVSISSTASSASMMLRKMGKSMRRGSKNIAGLFRPRGKEDRRSTDAVVGDIAAVTAEGQSAPATRPGLEQAVKRVAPVPIEDNNPDRRKSFVQERSMVSGRDQVEHTAAGLSSIFKQLTPAEIDSEQRREFQSSLFIPPFAFEVPLIPYAASDDAAEDSGHQRQVSDQSTHSMPSSVKSDAHSTPMSSTTSRGSISFSPRTVIHDTWTSAEYDRRGETATCNRLTPVLAQQIKEELNSFKMVINSVDISIG